MLAPEINAATIRLLTRLGVEVVVAQGAGCCGALTHHMGQHDPAMAARARQHRRLERGRSTAPGLDAIVINASGCGTTVKDYGFLFRNAARTVARRGGAGRGAWRVDITESLTAFGYAPTRPAPGLTVAYHSACSLQHGQQITVEPKTLLRERRLPRGGAGGGAPLLRLGRHLQPAAAGHRRPGCARASWTACARRRPDLVAAGNIGCITQLAGGGLPVVHTVELLDWMAGGPRPAGLPIAG